MSNAERQAISEATANRLPKRPACKHTSREAMEVWGVRVDFCYNCRTFVPEVGRKEH